MTTSTISAASWRKSTYSNADGNCVEVAIHPSAVAVRDSKHPSGPVLMFGLEEWRSFTTSLRSRWGTGPGPVARPV
jgi:hypothetical protein